MRPPGKLSFRLSRDVKATTSISFELSCPRAIARSSGCRTQPGISPWLPFANSASTPSVVACRWSRLDLPILPLGIEPIGLTFSETPSKPMSGEVVAPKIRQGSSSKPPKESSPVCRRIGFRGFLCRCYRGATAAWATTRGTSRWCNLHCGFRDMYIHRDLPVAVDGVHIALTAVCECVSFGYQRFSVGKNPARWHIPVTAIRARRCMPVAMNDLALPTTSFTNVRCRNWCRFNAVVNRHS